MQTVTTVGLDIAKFFRSTKGSNALLNVPKLP